MKVIITFAFCCDNLWKSKFMALEKPGKLREFFFSYTVWWPPCNNIPHSLTRHLQGVILGCMLSLGTLHHLIPSPEFFLCLRHRRVLLVVLPIDDSSSADVLYGNVYNTRFRLRCIRCMVVYCIICISWAYLEGGRGGRPPPNRRRNFCSV